MSSEDQKRRRLPRLPGRNAQKTASSRDMALKVRESVSPDCLRDYWLLTAMGKPNVHLDIDEDGDYFATWDDQGMKPTRQEMDNAVRELALRGWGQPAQNIQLETHLKAYISSAGAELKLSGYSPATLGQIKDLLLKSGDSDDNSDAIDAEFTEIEPETVESGGEDEAPPGGMDAADNSPE